MTDHSSVSDARIREAIIRLAGTRGSYKTICPSEVARDIGGSDPRQWRPLMPAVRDIAVSLALAGIIAIKKSGDVVDPKSFNGIYRIAICRDRDNDSA